MSGPAVCVCLCVGLLCVCVCVWACCVCVSVCGSAVCVCVCLPDQAHVRSLQSVQIFFTSLFTHTNVYTHARTHTHTDIQLCSVADVDHTGV